MKRNLNRILCCLLILAPPAHAESQQNHVDIRDLVANFARAQTAALPGQAAIKVGEIDRRITLSACASPEAFLPPGGRLLGNGTVGVRCPAEKGKKAWTLFVPVHVRITADLVITRTPISAGQMLRAGDLASQPGELSQTGILTDPAQAAGKVLKYSISAGQVLKQDMLRAPYAVTQGQTVQLRAEGAGFTLSSEGQALNNAAAGETVKVKTASGQVISGIAQENGVVATRP